jgi:hypothetical protein
VTVRALARQILSVRADQVFPSRVLRAYRAYCGRYHRNDPPLFGIKARPGPLASLYEEIKTLPGYFTYDDVIAFTLLLNIQSSSGVTGDLLEIGSYHGRSAAVIGRCVQPGERFIVCDTFDRPGQEMYPNPSSPEALRQTLARLAPDLQQVDIRASRSDELDLDGVILRFAHIDGGHSFDVALHDLRFTASHLAPNGIIAVDDYQHPDWQDVTAAVDTFVAESGFGVIADVNRWGESGRKIYLGRPSCVSHGDRQAIADTAAGAQAVQAPQPHMLELPLLLDQVSDDHSGVDALALLVRDGIHISTVDLVTRRCEPLTTHYVEYRLQ